jgi:hypothetical protein
MSEDFFSGSYAFGDGGKVEVHFDSKSDRFITIFTNDVKTSKQEWFTRVVQKMNELVIKNHDPRKIYFKVEYNDGKTTATTHSVDEGHAVKMVFDNNGNLFVKNGRGFRQIEINKEILATFNKLLELSNKEYDSVVEI